MVKNEVKEDTRFQMLKHSTYDKEKRLLWHSWNGNFHYACPECKDIISIYKNHKAYIQEKHTRGYGYRNTVTCPQCGHIEDDVRVGYYNVGAIKADINCKDNKAIFVACDINSYPESSKVIETSIDKLKLKEVIDFCDDYNLIKSDPEYNDLTNWGMIKDEMLEYYSKKYPNEIKSVINFLGKTVYTYAEPAMKLIGLMAILENKNIIKVIHSCNNKDAINQIHRLYSDLLSIYKNTCRRYNSKYAKFKRLFKNTKDLTEENLASGQVFSVPKVLVKNCGNLNTFDAVRLMYKKAENTEDFLENMQGMMLSQNEAFLKSFRKTLLDTTLSGKELVSICVLNLARRYVSYKSTCDTLSRLSRKDCVVQDAVAVSINEIETCRSSNEHMSNRYMEYDISNAKPQEKTLILDDIYTVTYDKAKIFNICLENNLYYTMIVELYNTNVGYFFINEDGTKSVFAKNQKYIFGKSETIE